jgi:hypothetical protein
MHLKLLSDNIKGRTIRRSWIENIKEKEYGNVGCVELALVGCWILGT